MSPLTAPVSVGYVDIQYGRFALTNGFYYWNGSTWLLVNSSANARNNFVLVKSAADFPAPVGGIITLAAGTTYEVNGTIMLTDRINLNGAWLRGVDGSNDRLIYTPPAGELFTRSGGGTIKTLTLSAPNAGATLFNINAAGANVNLVMESAFHRQLQQRRHHCGIRGAVFMQTVAYFANANGVTFSNDTNVVLVNTLWDKSNFNTYERFTGTFGVILKSGGAMQALSANTATALNVAGITGLTSGELKNVLFYGNGTYKTGTFSGVWEAEVTRNHHREGRCGHRKHITYRQPHSTRFCGQRTRLPRYWAPP